MPPPKVIFVVVVKEFWLPSQFLTNDYILMDINSNANSKNNDDGFQFRFASETDLDFLSNLCLIIFRDFLRRSWIFLGSKPDFSSFNSVFLCFSSLICFFL